MGIFDLFRRKPSTPEPLTPGEILNDVRRDNPVGSGDPAANAKRYAERLKARNSEARAGAQSLQEAEANYKAANDARNKLILKSGTSSATVNEATEKWRAASQAVQAARVDHVVTDMKLAHTKARAAEFRKAQQERLREAAEARGDAAELNRALESRDTAAVRRAQLPQASMDGLPLDNIYDAELVTGATPKAGANGAADAAREAWLTAYRAHADLVETGAPQRQIDAAQVRLAAAAKNLNGAASEPVLAEIVHNAGAAAKAADAEIVLAEIVENTKGAAASPAATAASVASTVEHAAAPTAPGLIHAAETVVGSAAPAAAEAVAAEVVHEAGATVRTAATAAAKPVAAELAHEAGTAARAAAGGARATLRQRLAGWASGVKENVAGMFRRRRPAFLHVATPAAGAVETAAAEGAQAAAKTGKLAGLMRVVKPVGIVGGVIAGLVTAGVIVNSVMERRRVRGALAPENASGGESYMNVPEASLDGPLVRDGQWTMNTRGAGRDVPPNAQPNIESPDGRPIEQLGSGPSMA